MQVQCPKCGSYKTISDKKTTMIVGLVFLVGGGLFSFLIFPLIFCVIGLVMILSGAFSTSKKMKCNSCHFKFEK